MASHRGHNAGSITEIKDKNGKVVAYRPQLSMPDGHRRSFPRVKTKREAQRSLDEAKAAAMLGKIGPGRSQSLAKYLDGWLTTQRSTVRSSTFDTYKRNVRRVSEQIGHININALKPSHVQNCYGALLDAGLSAQSVRQVHLTLHKALKDALRLDLVVRNATDGATLPRVRRTEMSWYSIEELERLFTSTEGDRFHALWVLLGTLGLRLGEALGLRWADIDFERRTVKVQRTVQRDRAGGGLVFGEPKSAKSRRTIELSSEALKAIEHHQERQTFEQTKAEDSWKDGDLIFCTGFGTPLDQGRIHYHWKNSVQKAGIPRYRIHDLRHSVATHLLLGGMSALEVAEILGHSSASLVLEVYGHVTPSSRGRAANIIDAMLEKERQAL